MYRIDERTIHTAELPQPAELAFANGLGMLLRERRRRLVRGTATELDVLAAIKDRSRAGASGHAGRRVETAAMGAQ
jgi:hypothetical protein